MTQWLRRLRGALGMGLIWGIAWALVGIGIGAASILTPALPWHYFFDFFDAPLPAMAVPGFFGGVCYSLVLGTAARNRRFSELSLARVAGWGAVGGVLLSLIPAALVGVGLATLGAKSAGVWTLTGVIIGPLTLLSVASASATFALARASERTQLDPVS